MFRFAQHPAETAFSHTASSAWNTAGRSLFMPQPWMQQRNFRFTPVWRKPENVHSDWDKYGPRLTKRSNHTAIAANIKSRLRTSFQGRKAAPARIGPLAQLGLGNDDLNDIRSLPDSRHFLQSFTEGIGSNGEKRVRLVAGSISKADGRSAKKGAKDPYGGIDTTHDDRGHLIPEKGVTKQFQNRVNQPDNVVPENRTVNQRHKKALEDAVKELSQEKGSRMEMFHKPFYSGDSQRPSHIDHYVVSNGSVIFCLRLSNPDGDISN